MKVIFCKNSFIIACFILFNFSSLVAQNSVKQFKEGLNMKFDAMEDKKLEHAVKILDQADASLNQANQQFAVLTELEKKERISDNYLKALKLLFNTTESYKEAYDLAYSVFKDKSTAFWEKMEKANHHASGMEKAKYYESQATREYNRSLIRNTQVLESDRFEYALSIMTDAVNLAKLFVRDQGRAVQICLDYPVEYNYGWDDDKTLEEIVKLMQDPNVHEPPTDIFATVDTDTKVIDSTVFKEIIFKVQIAAHTEPLSEEYLRTLYRGGMKIDMIYEEGWYKYSIGRYLTFDEAEATRRECEIKKAFVVAYQEGKKISTTEAIKILEEKNALKTQ